MLGESRTWFKKSSKHISYLARIIPTPVDNPPYAEHSFGVIFVKFGCLNNCSTLSYFKEFGCPRGFKCRCWLAGVIPLFLTYKGFYGAELDPEQNK